HGAPHAAARSDDGDALDHSWLQFLADTGHGGVYSTDSANRSVRMARTLGQSSSTTLYQALSRFSPPRTSMCLRWIPSNVAPIASIALREPSFTRSVLSSTRPHT